MDKPTTEETQAGADCGKANMTTVCPDGHFRLRPESGRREYYCKRLNGWCQPFAKATGAAAS